MVPVLTTERLTLRPWTTDPADVRAAFELYGEPDVTRYIGGQTAADLDEMHDQLADRIERTSRYPTGLGAWAVELDVVPVGTGLLKPLPDREGVPTNDIEVGWHVARSAWNRGLATEMGRRLDELGLADIHAVVEPENLASQTVAKRVGLSHVGSTTAYYGGLLVEHFRLVA